jgi:hypothetical protein
MVSDTAFIFRMIIPYLIQDLSIGTKNSYLLTLTLKFGPLHKNCNIGNIFYAVSDSVTIDKI